MLWAGEEEEQGGDQPPAAALVAQKCWLCQDGSSTCPGARSQDPLSCPSPWEAPREPLAMVLGLGRYWPPPLGRTRPLKVPRNLFTCPPLPHVAVWRPDGRGPICQARALGAQSSWGCPLLRTPQATPELGTPLVTGSFLSLLYQPVMAHRHSLAPPWPSSHNQVVTCDPCPPAPQLHLWEQSPQLSGGDPP